MTLFACRTTEAQKANQTSTAYSSTKFTGREVKRKIAPYYHRMVKKHLESESMDMIFRMQDESFNWKMLMLYFCVQHSPYLYERF